MNAHRYALHGLELESDLPLPLGRSAGGGEPALAIRRRRTATIPDVPAEGEPLGALGEPPDRVWWTLDGDAYTIRFAGLCDLRLAPPWRTVEVADDPGAPAEVVGDRIIKTALPFALEWLGHDLLHAGAVVADGVTIAVVGPSGTGKSTLVALFCADGAALVSDDQLRVELEPGAVMCHPGLDAIRLRPDVRPVAGLVGGVVRPTWDDRIAVSPGVPVTRRLRVDALLLPSVVDEASVPAVERLTPSEALVPLSHSRAVPRDGAWRLRRFELHADLLERVPAFAVRLPRGSLPDRSFRQELLERVAPERSAIL